MKIKKTISINKIFYLLLICFIINSCTEPYILETNTYEEGLVVEATITNEFKKQEIILAKTSRFEDKEPKTESGAEVFVTDNTGNKFLFEEQSGIYVSKSEFKAIPGREYHIDIKTSDGKIYRSATETLSPVATLEDVKPIIETKDTLKGVQIYVSSYDPTNKAKFYRFEYEETYKIFAPRLSPKIIFETGPETLGLKDRDPSIEIRTCYNTVKSKDLTLISTKGLSESRINTPIRYISNTDPIIANRYSILVRQYTQNIESYTYHKTLKEMSGTSGFLSPKQPGFLIGNIKCITNANEKVIGFFEVAAVSSKRIYFNFDDLFLGDAYPPYFCDCSTKKRTNNFRGCGRYCDGTELHQDILFKKQIYVYGEDPNYGMVLTPCGDCTAIGSNIKPAFWKD